MKTRIVALACLAFASGCNQPTTSQADIDTLRSQVQGLSVKVNSTQGVDAAALDKRLGAVEADVWWMKQVADLQNKAIFDPISSNGYQTVDVGLAKLAVQVFDVQAYADGTRVTLTVGNPTSASFNGLAAEIRYGGSISAVPGKTTWAAWNAAMQAKKVDLIETIAPGRWTRLTFTLPRIKPDQLGRLELALSSNLIELYQSK